MGSSVGNSADWGEASQAGAVVCDIWLSSGGWVGSRVGVIFK